MKLNFSIEYRTSWGEEVVLCLGGKRYPLSYVAEGIWQGEIARFKPDMASEYTYEVVRDGMTVRTEWKKHLLVLPEDSKAKVVNIYDRWNDRPEDAPFYSSAFTKAIFGRPASKVKKAPKGANVLLQVAAPALRPNEVLALAGSGKALKNWEKIVPFDATFRPGDGTYDPMLSTKVSTESAKSRLLNLALLGLEKLQENEYFDETDDSLLMVKKYKENNNNVLMWRNATNK